MSCASAKLQSENMRDSISSRRADISFTRKKTRDNDLGNSGLFRELIGRFFACLDRLSERFANRVREDGCPSRWKLGFNLCTNFTVARSLLSGNCSLPKNTF